MNVRDFNMPETDEEAKAYLASHIKSMKNPPGWEDLTIRCVTGIYECRRDMGESIADSCIAALKALIGEEA